MEGLAKLFTKFPEMGNLKIALGTSVGTLLAGVVVGWARSVRPWFGRFPDATILFHEVLWAGSVCGHGWTQGRPDFYNRRPRAWLPTVPRWHRGDDGSLISRPFLRLLHSQSQPRTPRRRTRWGTNNDRGCRSCAREIRQPGCHAGLLVHSGVWPHFPDYVGHHNCLPHDVTEFNSGKEL